MTKVQTCSKISDPRWLLRLVKQNESEETTNKPVLTWQFTKFARPQKSVLFITIHMYMYLYRQGPINGPPDEKLPTEDLCQRFKVAAVEALRCQHWDVAVSWPEKSAQIPYLVANLSVSAWNLCFFPSKRRSNQTRKDWFSWSVIVVFSEVWCLWLL